MALERFRNLEPLARAVGLLLVGKSQAAFRQQGRPAGSWAARGVPNRIGVLMGLKAGRVPPERRFEPRPAAIDTGALRQSISSTVSGSTVRVGTNLAYAGDVQRGSTKTITVDSGTRKALADWLRTLTGARKQEARRAFGFLFRTGSLTVTVPPRPFLVLTDEDRKQIQRPREEIHRERR